MTSSFGRKVLRLLRRIPRGRVATYSALARLAGRPRAARAVGNILRRNLETRSGLPAGRQVPCHRVIRADGRLGGYARGVRRKAAFLESEGVVVERGRVDLSRFGWWEK